MKQVRNFMFLFWWKIIINLDFKYNEVNRKRSDKIKELDRIKLLFKQEITFRDIIKLVEKISYQNLLQNKTVSEYLQQKFIDFNCNIDEDMSCVLLIYFSYDNVENNTLDTKIKIKGFNLIMN